MHSQHESCNKISAYLIGINSMSAQQTAKDFLRDYLQAISSGDTHAIAEGSPEFSRGSPIEYDIGCTRSRAVTFRS